MLKFFNGNQNNVLKKLELVLNKRKLKQTSKITVVKSIIANVKKKGDRAVIQYERKFSNLRKKSSKLKFSNKEINFIQNK